MLKSISLALALAVAGTTAIAGTPVYVAPAAAPMMMEEPTGSMGSSGAWIIPIIAIALIAVVVATSNEEDEEDDNEG